MEYEYKSAKFITSNKIIITGYQRYLNREPYYQKHLATVEYSINVGGLSSFMPIIREGEPVDFNKMSLGERNLILSSIEENGKIPLNYLPLSIITETPSTKIYIIIGVTKDGKTICIRKEAEKRIGSDDIEHEKNSKESIITWEEAARDLKRSGIDLEASKSSLPKDQISNFIDARNYRGFTGMLTKLTNFKEKLIRR